MGSELRTLTSASLQDREDLSLTGEGGQLDSTSRSVCPVSTTEF
jgi:hypothetical protein